jgi:hypothetical protein
MMLWAKERDQGIGDVLSFQLRIHLLHSLARGDAPRVVCCECGAAQALAEDFVAGAGAEGVVELGEDAALDLDGAEVMSMRCEACWDFGNCGKRSVPLAGPVSGRLRLPWLICVLRWTFGCERCMMMSEMYDHVQMGEDPETWTGREAFSETVP